MENRQQNTVLHFPFSIFHFPLLLLVFHFPFSIALAQQRAQYSQYMNNQLLLNPAVAGTAEAFDLRTGGRLQWAGFKDAPHSFYVAVQSPVGKPAGGSYGRSRVQKQHFFGFGAVATAEVTGPTSRTAFYLAGSYNKAFTKTIRASFGFFGGLQQFALNGDKLIYADRSAGKVQGFSRVFPDAGVGMWVYSKQFYAGGSVLQIFRNSFSTYDASQGIYVANRHLFLTTGYNFHPTKTVEVQPSILIKKVAPSPWSVDLNVRVRFDQQFWVGASYRTSDALVFMAGFRMQNQFDVGYSYDAVLSEIGRFSGGSHELFIGYRVASKRKVYNPSDFWR